MDFFVTEKLKSIDVLSIMENFKNTHSDAMFYLESVLQYKLGKLEKDTTIPTDFDFLRLFSSNEEIKIKKYPTYYHVVKLNKALIPQEKKQFKTLLIDDTAKENNELPYDYLEIEMIEDGDSYFESWKGVK